MAIEWVDNPVSTPMSLAAYVQPVTLQGNKSLGGGNSRSMHVTVTWYWEGDEPIEADLMDDLENVWDTVANAGYTVTGASVNREIGGNIVKS